MRFTVKSVSVSPGTCLYAVCICVLVIAEQKQKTNRAGINQADVQPVGKPLSSAQCVEFALLLL